MAFEVTASTKQINPNFQSMEGYELSGQEIVPNEEIIASFVPYQDLVEFWVYDSNNNFLSGSENFLDYTLIPNPNKEIGEGTKQPNTSTLELNPIQDTINLGYDTGILNTVYNFINYKLGTNQTSSYYLSEISSDRTELRLNSNFISNEVIQSKYLEFKSEVDGVDYVDEFYLNFGDNQYQVCVNSQLDTSAEQYSILIKLFDPLPNNFILKDKLSVVIKPAESVAYQVTQPPIDEQSALLDVTFLKGPNTNLSVNDFLNNSTPLQSKDELLNTVSSASADNLSNILNQKGVALTPNYSFSTFDEFVNFSSAKTRIENFVEKVTQIQSYEADIETLNTITGNTSGSSQVSSSIASAYSNINTLIKNFDGYEYFLYYSSGPSSYPKTGSAQPYELLPTTDVSVSVWLGSDVENSQYYGGISLSASLFDNSNQNWLYYTIPEFIRDNSENNQYLEFSNMVGQHFDEVWLYTRAITEKLNTTSQLTDGVPLDLADDVIAGLGYDGFGNNFNNQDNYIGLLGEDNGIYVPPTGSELITNYIAVNNGKVINYWNLGYAFIDYVTQINDPGYPYAIDKVSKEIFKRLYHNMSYLVKKKGTISGLRQLINIWGIPNTILRINEFGGKNKDNIDDYDLWYNRYSYAFSPISIQNIASASVVFPWMPLERNRIADNEYIVPDNFQFRFKTTGYPSSSFAGEFFTQSLAVKKSDGDLTTTEFDFGISLFYEPVATGSYSGSYSSEYEDWGKMRFYISGAASDGGVATSNDIYLPFYDKGWWSVMLQRNQHVSASDNTANTTYTLYAKNKINNGFDGNSIGFEGSASIVTSGSTFIGALYGSGTFGTDTYGGGFAISESLNSSWNKFGTTEADGIYLGGFVSGSTIGGVTTGLPGKIFSGSLQEFRYYSNDIPEATFNDFVMNPESIEGNNITGSESSFDIVNFRAPLGNELENLFTSSLSSSYSDPLISMHPAIQGTADLLITGSFVNPSGNVTSSVYNVLYYANTTTRTYSTTNTEVYFLDQPAIGFRNRISNKIQIRDGDDYGNILSNRISIQQDYQISQSYTENINNLEVAFSPQDEVNDDIIASFGYGVVADAIADPRFVSSSDDYYPRLRDIAKDYFKKYTEGNVYDYLRLIKYFDNSIFKAIKAYVPARTNVSTGIVIKQHMLERNRFPPVQISEGTTIALTPSGGLNTPIIRENIVLTSSIDIVDQYTTTGNTGGSLTKFNYVGNQFTQSSGPNQGLPASSSFFQIPISQSWDDNIATIVGLKTFVRNEQDEFYNGEFSGSEFIATTQSLFYNPYLGITPPTTPTSVFQNSVYYATPNNVNENRPNTDRYVVENQFGINTTSNLQEIFSGSAIKIQTPNSNYTSKKVIIPRYLGSKVSSADYNFYTPSGSTSASFANGSTGSWDGDNVYGKTAAIDKHPRYFAHFKSSKENYELWDSYTFRIDQLIECPLYDITGENAPNTPTIVDINGSNNNLLNVSSTFEYGRKATISYDIGNVAYSGSRDVNYTALEVGDNKIYQGSLEYNTIITDQPNPIEFVDSMSFDVPSYLNMSYQSGSSSTRYQTNYITLSTASTGVYPFRTDWGAEHWMATGSDADGGFLRLMGGGINITGSSGTTLSNLIPPNQQQLIGPGLGTIHSFNKRMKLQLDATGIDFSGTGDVNFMKIGKPSGSIFNPNDSSNYFSFNFSQSAIVTSGADINNYEDFNLPFLIERGDEIRVTWNTNKDSQSTTGSSQPIYQTQDFTVLSTPSASANNSDYSYFYTLNFQTANSASIYDKIYVDPDPSLIYNNLDKIFNFTIRRRVNADDRVIVYQTPPTGSQGINTLTPSGYLIPNDFSRIQNKNVLTLINQLKAKNANTATSGRTSGNTDA